MGQGRRSFSYEPLASLGPLRMSGGQCRRSHHKLMLSSSGPVDLDKRHQDIIAWGAVSAWLPDRYWRS